MDGVFDRPVGYQDQVPASDSPGELPAQRPVAVLIDQLGNHRVQKFRRDGSPLGTWGHSGREPGELNNPWALAVDQHGDVSVIDSNNHRVQRFRL